MKLYKPSSENPYDKKKSDQKNEKLHWAYDLPVFGFKPDSEYNDSVESQAEKLVSRFAVNHLLAPFAFFGLILALGAFPILAFGKHSDWGSLPKMLVAIGEPLLIIIALTKTNVGNIIFLFWYWLFYTSLSLAFGYFIVLPILIEASKKYLELF